MKYFAIYDKETGFVRRTGSCSNETDVAIQVTNAGRDGLVMLDAETDPNSIRVDVATKSVVKRAI